MSTRQHGLTLIELVVALAIFAMLGVLSYKGVTQVLTGQSMVHDELERWRELSRALLRVENDLLQAASLPVAANTQSVPAMNWDAEHEELDWLALTSAGDGSRRVAFRLREQQLLWLRWDDRNGNGKPREDILLEGVRSLRWTFFYQKKSFNSWPPEAGLTQLLPDGVQLDIDVDRIGPVSRTYALR